MLNGGSCSSAVVAAREYVERAKVPFIMLNASGDGALYPPSKYIYGAFSISQYAVGGSMVEFAVDHLKAKKIGRSEEHTSELQSLMRISYAVFCLKKKKKNKTKEYTSHTYTTDTT